MTKRPTASISRIIFSGGQEFNFGPNEKVILVGPNNSGKSQTLREVMDIAQHSNRGRTIVVKQVDFAKVGTSVSLKIFLEDNATAYKGGYRYKSWSIESHVLDYWDSPHLQHGLAAGYIKNINANDRLRICDHQNSIGPTDQKSKPQHVLYDDSSLMDTVSGLFRQAFGKDIMFDYRGGNVIPIHVGEKPFAAVVDRVGDEYVAAVRANPLLVMQGDGMKSYAGILFETIVADLDVNLLDEPEAFLHPPQMRRLGETLASQIRGQLIVATHSSDIMRGFLEGTRGDVRVLRIRREGDRNFVSEAAPDVVRELWARPALRYSNALDAVFHEQAIICEDDSDCRLFNATADYLSVDDGRLWKDTAYIPTGGKHAARKIAEVLRKIGVPVKAVFDMDFLSERELVADTVRAFGGNWASIEPLWNRVDKAIRSGVTPKSFDEIKDELLSLIDTCTGPNLPRKDMDEVVKQFSAWNSVKRFGSNALPNGEAQSQFSALRDCLEQIGIYLVPVGEVENFCRDLGAHGPKFVNKLLTSVPLNDRRLEALRTFVRHIYEGPHSPLPS